jgi:hypothetical protein
MEKLIKKYFLNEGSKLVKVGPINNGQCDAWFEDEAENVQHRCVEHKDIIRYEIINLTSEQLQNYNF